jgi:hypothetical protein
MTLAEQKSGMPPENAASWMLAAAAAGASAAAGVAGRRFQGASLAP